jgi:spermidine synthase
MVPWVEIDRAKVPEGGELRLLRRGAEFSIMAGPIVLMNNRVSGSEEQLAVLALERLGGRARPRLLIGGLGMGFTLRAALAARADVDIVVAELLPAIVAWARGPLAELFAGSLDDQRVRIEIGDVGALIRAGRKEYDAILLDVDNGPEGLTRDGNGGLYAAAGLRSAWLALRPGGLLAVWSAHPSPAFTRLLGQCGFAVEEIKLRARGKSGGSRHTIWMARRP